MRAFQWALPQAPRRRRAYPQRYVCSARRHHRRSQPLGPQLRAVWLYGSRARGETPRTDSDVDLLVIATGDIEGHQRLALELSEAVALAAGEDPFASSVHIQLLSEI